MTTCMEVNLRLTDNNPLTYIFTTAKLDATWQRWVASLSDYNFCNKYRRGRNNAAADGLKTRKTDPEPEKVIFPEVFKAICQFIAVTAGQCPFIESVTVSDSPFRSEHSRADA